MGHIPNQEDSVSPHDGYQCGPSDHYNHSKMSIDQWNTFKDMKEVLRTLHHSKAYDDLTAQIHSLIYMANQPGLAVQEDIQI